MIINLDELSIELVADALNRYYIDKEIDKLQGLLDGNMSVKIEELKEERDEAEVNLSNLAHDIESALANCLT